jgi:serine/threonine protein kinase
MSKQFIVIKGLDRGRVFPLPDANILEFGCSQTIEIETRLRDPGVARVHCEVQVNGNRVLVSDVCTPTGTFVNGKRITQALLQPGDVIRIGNTEMRYLSDEATTTEIAALTQTLPLDSTAAAPEGKKKHLPLKQLVGKKIGPYKVGVILGTGHWGRVFRALDTRSAQVVALKVLRPEFGEHPAVRPLLAQTLKAVQSLQHPNLLTHLGAGIAGPYCWIAMEYIEGRSLTQVIRRSSTTDLLDWRYVLRIALQLAQALEAAHKQRLIHGHITPQNILVRDQDQCAKLGDLLLAATLNAPPLQPMTRLGERVDDVPYMSPERTRGTAGVDARSDVYSLGATVYALLTGRPPFEGDSQVELIEPILYHEPVRPKTYQPTLPDLFQSVVLKMLAKRPEERFQTPTELLSHLARVGDDLGERVIPGRSESRLDSQP